MPLPQTLAPSPFDDPEGIYSQSAPVQSAPAIPVPRGYEVSPAGNVWRSIRGPFQLSAADPSQALEEYAARVAQPRTSPLAGTLASPPGGILPEDTPAALEESLLRPFYVGAALGASALGRGRLGSSLLGAAALQNRFPQSRNVGGSLLERDPLTGQWKVTFSPPPKQPAVSELAKKQASILEDQIKKTHTAYLKPGTAESKRLLAITLRNLNQQLKDLLASTPGVTAPATQQWQIDPETIPSGSPTTMQLPRTLGEANALDRFGQPGPRTPFAFTGGAPAAAPQQAEIVRRTKDGRRAIFNANTKEFLRYAD